MPSPCDECPFRRASAPGWLGEHAHPREIILHAQHGRFPCHKSVNFHKDNGLEFDDAVEKAMTCRGSLIYLNNTCSISRDDVIRKEQSKIGKSDEVFANAAQMVEHHTGKKVDNPLTCLFDHIIDPPKKSRKKTRKKK